MILPVSMQVHPVNLGKKVLIRHLKTKSSEHRLTIHTADFYKSWLLQAFSEFPFKQLNQNYKLLPVYENVFQPRQGRHSSNSVFVRILWTNTQAWPDRFKEFTVNHFVPLFKRGDEVFKPQNSAGRKEHLVMFSSKQSYQSNSQTEKDSNNVTAHLSKVKGRHNI